MTPDRSGVKPDAFIKPDRKRAKPDGRRGPRTGLNRQTAKVMYLGLGPARSLRNVIDMAETIGAPVALSTVSRWSKQDRWVEEAKRFDEQEGAKFDQNLRDAIADNIRHASFGRAFQELALLGIAAKRTDEEGQPRSRVELSGSEIARLGEVGIKIERLASGMATDRMEIMSGAMRVIVEEIGPAVMAMLDALSARLDSVTPEMSAAEVVLLMRSAMDGERSTFAIRADNIIEAEFRAYGLVPEQATVPHEDEE